jgi:hypothetical protein
MQIPEYAQSLVDSELMRLAKSSKYYLSAAKEVQICEALGYAGLSNDEALGEEFRINSVHSLTPTEHVWARIALITAKKVLPLWGIACQETALYFTEQDWHYHKQDQLKEDEYLHKRNTLAIEMISVDDVPRKFIPSHIIEMAETLLAGKIHDYSLFEHEANEWWGIYGRPEKMEREFCIKWAAQNALYAALGWQSYDPDPPIAFALYAFAGVFKGDGLHKDREAWLDENKQHEFWVWWLSETIAQAYEEVS